MPFRVPELYIEAEDTAERALGNVYIEDLALSGVMMAMKVNCAPQGLGFLASSMVSQEDSNIFHKHLSAAVKNALEDNAFVPILPLAGVQVGVNYEGHVQVGADYWDGRPFKTYFTAGESMDPTILTGFKPFDPWGFDRDQGPGAAQEIVDALRRSNDPTDWDVVVQERGRTIDRARQANEQVLPAVAHDPELFEALSDALARYDDLTDR